MDAPQVCKKDLLQLLELFQFIKAMNQYLVLAYYFLLLFVANFKADTGSHPPKTRIRQGKLVGKYVLTREGRNVAAFLGIPYALPPVGELRFAAPKQPSGWEGERNATISGAPCVQLLSLGALQFVYGFEDCLYLNIFTPEATPKLKLPVMIYLHGGGYVWGSNSHTVYGPEYILDQNIVLVVINFRLGPLGFLSMEDNVLPGNYGLKDQSAAFRWVRDNIRKFGGDPDSVTIFGESAGGSSVHYHMKSPLSKGLFHRAISQSGSSLCSWTNSPAGLYRERGSKLANLLGCPSTPTTSMLQCLRNVSPYDMTQILVNFTVWDVDPAVVFPPAVEPKDVEDAFLTADPWTIPTSIPWLTGILSEEGAFRVSTLTKDNTPEERLQELNSNFSELGSLTLLFDKTAPNPQAAALQVREFYFGEKQINNETLEELVNMYTDAYFLYCCKEAVRRHYGVVFLYYFSYDGANSLSPVYGNTRDDLGVCHADDLLYLFTLQDFVPVRNVSAPDDQLSINIVKIWTNFAIYGNPTPAGSPFKWPPVCTDNNYLNISNSGFSKQTNLLTERDNFWANLTYREKPHVNPRYWDCLEDLDNTCT